MAEFGVQATQLSAPQGAGAQVVQGVEEKAVSTSMASTLASVGDVISSGIRAVIKQNAKDAEATAVGQYSQEIAAVNEGLRTGALKAGEAAARSQAIFGKYATAFPAYQESLSKAAAGFKGYTEIGTAVKQVETEAEVRKSAILSAQNSGYVFFEGMDKKAEDAAIAAHQTSLRVNGEYDRYLKQQAEKRAQGTYDRGVAEQEGKAIGVRLINDIAGTQLGAVREFSVSLGQSVRNGKTTPDEAKALIASRFSQINLALQSAAGVNPELAAPYRTIFGDIQKMAEQLADPKTQADQLQAQMDALVTRQKIIALQDPTAARAVATSQLFGNNSQVLLSNSPVVAATITKMLGTDPAAPLNNTPVVGNTEVEKPTYDFLRKSMNSLNSGQYPDGEKAKQEIDTAVRHVLKQTSQMLGTGASAKNLEQAASFFASPEYGKWASTNKMSVEEQTAAYKTFQMVYEPAVVKGIEQRLNAAFVTNTGLVPGRAATGATVQPQLGKLDKENFTVNFSGSGVTFGMKKAPADGLEARAANQTLQGLKGTEAAVNQLIRMGAHMEGTTDYAKYWESNKHILLPQLFSAYKGLEICQVVNGMTYKGGDPKKQESWE